MEETYRIGRHEFNTREEWKNALRDLKTIESVVDQYDIDNPRDVLAVYNLIREGKIAFAGELGTAFFCDISDRVANNTGFLLRENRKQERELVDRDYAESEERSRKSSLFQRIGIACIALSVLCLGIYFYTVQSERSATRKLEKIREQKNISQVVDWYLARNQDAGDGLETGSQAGQAGAEGGGQASQSGTSQVLPEYAALSAKYPELVGWIQIADTEIDLPVMQTVDNDYYLHYDIDREEDKNGTLFLDYRADAGKPSTNLIIYGHNMKSGAMFGGLKEYLEEDYAASHDRIQFDTLYEKQEYQLIAVCLSEVGYQDDEESKYYNFIDAKDAESFQSFVEMVRGCAVYDNSQNITTSDHFLTLSTCNSYVEDGRLFLVAKKIE